MTIAKIAYITFPDAGRYIFHYQAFGSEELTAVEISADHMRNILADGVHTMLRQSFHRVPVHTNTENADERAGA